MSDFSAKTWTVSERRLIARYVVDRDLAPLLTLEQRVGLRARCPNGHDLPFEVTADKEVVEATRGEGVTLACAKCEENFTLDFGDWPK
jgi:hypothetical protein